MDSMEKKIEKLWEIIHVKNSIVKTRMVAVLGTLCRCGSVHGQ